MSGIGARIIILQVNTCDHESLLTNIKDYAKKKELGYVFTHDGVLQLDGRGRKIYLKQGVKTFERSLTLSGTPTRISRYAKLPDDFLVDVCGDTFDVSMFAGVSPEDVKRYTAIHRAAVVGRAEKQTATARRNDMIMAATTSEQMLALGLTSIEKLPSTLAGKELQEKILKEQKHVNQVECCSIRVESQRFGDGDSFIVQTLKHGWCRVVHPTFVDVTNTCITSQFVSFQPGRIFPQTMFTLATFI